MSGIEWLMRWLARWRVPAARQGAVEGQWVREWLPVSLGHLEDSSCDGWGVINQSTKDRFRLTLFFTASDDIANVIDYVFFRAVLLLLTRSVQSGSSIIKHLQVALAQRDNCEPTQNEQQMHLKILDHIAEVWNFLRISSVTWSYGKLCLEWWKGA